MPSPTTEEMTEQLKTLVTGLDDAFARFELLDETGRVPSTPLFSRLMQHADAAKELSRTAVHLAAVVGIPDADSVVDREMDSKIRARLANVAEHTLRAVDLFTRTAETSASPACGTRLGRRAAARGPDGRGSRLGPGRTAARGRGHRRNHHAAQGTRRTAASPRLHAAASHHHTLAATTPSTANTVTPVGRS